MITYLQKVYEYIGYLHSCYNNEQQNKRYIPIKIQKKH